MLAGLAVLLSWFLFSPSSAHNWMLGMSGTAWFTANMFFLAALYFACRTLTARKPFLYFILLILCSLLGSVTYT
ncbi:MAG TPA: hypothetical protein VKS21_12380, partial [Spirochaetota bacterium]|nr:hypothetical protein [Spirochaetota bacterium]